MENIHIIMNDPNQSDISGHPLLPDVLDVRGLEVGVSVKANQTGDEDIKASVSHTNQKDAAEIDVATETEGILELWQQELKLMSNKDRRILDDVVRGRRTSAPVVETAEMLQIALGCMELEIQALPDSQKHAYNKGLNSSSKYIHDPEFRLGFIRAEVYDPKKAAVRFCKWLELLVEFYGDFALTRRLYYSDLRKEELELMKEGAYQLLPSRDRIGRRVLTLTGSWDVKKYNVACRTRLCMYYATVVAEDIMTQRDGLVFVMRPALELNVMMAERESVKMGKRLVAASPTRYSGFHICLPDEPVYQFLKQVCVSTLGAFRKFIRVHTMSPTETEYILRNEYGIPTHEFPSTGTGRIKTKNLNNWIKFRIKLDEKRKTSLPFHGIDCPDLNSIAIRNGGLMFHHPPNKAFRSYLRDREEKREQARKNTEKQRVVIEIVKEVQAKGFRYVKWDGTEGYYVPVTDPDEIRTFVATSLRDQMKRSKAQKNLMVQKSANREDYFLSGPSEKKLKRGDSSDKSGSSGTAGM
mmetsp:Transcript_26054/g.45910  ORF Transcript_26054/g.45910 Transcript_26054/m.45910 type:complete len:525 (+) Transcript_26054:102-1676(+)